MIPVLNQLGSRLFELLGPLSLELTVLAVVVLLAGRLLRDQSPALRHLLWLAVLLKPIIAVTISSPWTAFTPLIAWLGPGWFAVGQAVWTLRVEEPLVVSPSVIHGVATPLTFAGRMAVVWLIGAALLACRILIGFGVTWRIRRHARIHRAGLLFGALQKARLALDLGRGVEVASSRSVRTPIVLGVLRPLVVVPAGIQKKVALDGLVMVLMHELAHARRYDNLTLLIQKVITVVLFFHPAVWLCGCMLRREAEQASDDLVLLATGRSEDYARSLTRIAELAQLKTHLKRRIPAMSVFEATESDLSLRIRRALGGGARRMGTLTRVLVAVLLCGAYAVTLPSSGIADTRDGGTEDTRTRTERGQRDGVDWRAAMATDPDEWSEELKAQIVAAGHDLQKTADGIRQRRVWQEATATDPDEWSEELKTQLLALDPGSTLAEIAEGIRRRQRAEREGDTANDRGESGDERIWRAAMATDPGEWSEELKAQLLELAPGRTIEDIAGWIRQRQTAVRERVPSDDSGEDDALREFQRGVAQRAMAIPPEEWDDGLKAAIVRAGWDLDEFAEGIRLRQAAAATGAESGKEAVGPELSKHRAVILAEVTRDGTPASRLEVAFSRSISGRALDFAWSGTTDADGRAEIEITVDPDGEFWRKGASGYYVAHATDPASGAIVARWGSIPITGGKSVALSLPLAGRVSRLEGYALNSSMPNPFNPQTTIRYAIPEASDVQVVVYNLTGQKVRTLSTGLMEAGSHQLVWDGLDDSGRQVASGTYLVEMKAGSFSQTIKVTLAK